MGDAAAPPSLKVALHVFPCYLGREEADEFGNGLGLFYTIIMSIRLIRKELGSFCDAGRQFKVIHQFLRHIIESIRVVLVVKHQGGNIEIHESNSKGQIVPLDIAEEVSLARNSIKRIDEIGISRTGFYKSIFILTLAPFLFGTAEREEMLMMRFYL